MFWSEDDLQKWVAHINSIVGNDSTEGACLVAEKTDSVEVSMAGDKSELLQLLASCIYNFSKMNEMAFEDVLTELTETWDTLRNKHGYMLCGDEVIDMKTGIGFNDKTDMISFPIPPKEVQDRMLEMLKETTSKTEEVKRHLHSREDIIAYFGECETVRAFKADEESGGMGLLFVHNGDKFVYLLEAPGSICYVSEQGKSIDYFEGDELFREYVLKLLANIDI